MKNVKLSKKVRVAVFEALAQQIVKPGIAKVKESGTKLADAIYAAHTKGIDFSKIPSEYLNLEQGIYLKNAYTTYHSANIVNMYAASRYAHYKTSSRYIHTTNKNPMPNTGIPIDKLTKPLQKKLDAHYKLADGIILSDGKFLQNLMQALDNCTAVDQLIKLVPAAKAHVVVPMQLPAVLPDTTNLNKVLNKC